MSSKIQDKIRERAIKLAEERKNMPSKEDTAILELYQKYIALERSAKEFDAEKIKTLLLDILLKLPPVDRHLKIYDFEDSIIYDLCPRDKVSSKIIKANNMNRNLYFVSDAFLRSILSGACTASNDENFYRHNVVGYIIEDLTTYFDATRPSRMEMLINSNFIISEEEKSRSRTVIDKIIKNKISKYNNQPIYTPQIGREGVKKVLVIDQAYNDYSIIKGMASAKTFNDMLKRAIEENPDADIIIKTHPDVFGNSEKRKKCYYQSVIQEGNIYKISEMINPISLLEYADKVYVCTSQLGFEALMMGKEVHVFGMPFYAGWGLTNDALICDRRTRTRTLEELFYIAYIHMPIYINPDANKACEIEEAIDILMRYREKYFKEVENA